MEEAIARCAKRISKKSIEKNLEKSLINLNHSNVKDNYRPQNFQNSNKNQVLEKNVDLVCEKNKNR